jgi:TusA-related sulfurtransferase
VSSSGSGTSPAILNVTGYFNPVDCRSLGVIRTTLAPLESGELLEVVANRFQSREIQSWTRKFRHEIVSLQDVEGQVTLVIKKDGLKP